MIRVDDRTADVLEESVVAVRSGEKHVADCIREHPENEDLQSLLPLALTIRPPAAMPDALRKIRARHAFIETIHAERERQQARRFGPFVIPRFLPSARSL